MNRVLWSGIELLTNDILRGLNVNRRKTSAFDT